MAHVERREVDKSKLKDVKVIWVMGEVLSLYVR